MTGLSTGFAVITVTTLHGGYTASCLANVVGDTVLVTGVGLSKTSTVIAVGGSERLDAVIFPVDATDPRVDWSWSDPAIAAVSAAGVVTAVSAGTAEVTVETMDGHFEANCTVQVTSTPVAVTGIALAKSTTALLAGHGEQLAAAVTPSQATNQGIL